MAALQSQGASPAYGIPPEQVTDPFAVMNYGVTTERVADWLGAGTELVWVIDPERSEARVYRQDGSLAVLGEHDSLDGEDVLPGFSCPLRAVLAV